jgi:hypothetical protein
MELKKICKEKGFLLDTQGETVRALEKYVQRAEKELQNSGKKTQTASRMDS